MKAVGNVGENSPADTVVAIIKASDADNDLIYYYIVGKYIPLYFCCHACIRSVLTHFVYNLKYHHDTILMLQLTKVYVY